MGLDQVLFWFLSAFTVLGALGVLLQRNPLYSAFSLVLTMIGIGSLFVTLDAFFLAGVQVVVYAGAVMVLFIMVLMIFDLKKEFQKFSKGVMTGFLKLASVAMICGLITGAVMMSTEVMMQGSSRPEMDLSVKTLSELIFTKYLFAFEAVGVLLLFIAIGAVALSRSKGGTHAKH